MPAQRIFFLNFLEIVSSLQIPMKQRASVAGNLIIAYVVLKLNTVLLIVDTP